MITNLHLLLIIGILLITAVVLNLSFRQNGHTVKVRNRSKIQLSEPNTVNQALQQSQSTDSPALIKKLAKGLRRNHSQLGTTNRIWDLYIDRQYYRNELLPLAGHHAGTQGKVIEIGYEPYNADDYSMANLTADQWHFVDPIKRKIPLGTNFTFIKKTLRKVAEELSLSHAIKVIIDYGVLGFRSWKWSDNSVITHVNAYSPLLERGDGLLLLKWDLGWQRMPAILSWIKARNLISKQFRMAHYYLQVSKACPAAAIGILESNLNMSNTTATFNQFVLFRSCDVYLHTRWVPTEEFTL